MVLTSFGAGLVAGYRRLDSRLQPLAKTCLQEFGRQIGLGTPKRTVGNPLDQTQVAGARTLAPAQG